MTRINAGYNPKRLTDKHLLAEHREIKRIPNMVRSGKAKLDNIPSTFTMGKGHVKFFYNKLKWLFNKYNNIYLECKRRGFNVTPYYDAWSPENEVEIELIHRNFNNWVVTKEAKKHIEERINERLNK